jgi:hypothetical protein
MSGLVMHFYQIVERLHWYLDDGDTVSFIPLNRTFWMLLKFFALFYIALSFARMVYDIANVNFENAKLQVATS